MVSTGKWIGDTRGNSRPQLDRNIIRKGSPDVENNQFFLSEAGNIWRYSSTLHGRSTDADRERSRSDVEGLAIYRKRITGYLFASQQGSNNFRTGERPSELITSFSVESHGDGWD
jgi:myo-inositol-hexaphosphate 3-phosphohydrolase